MEFLEQGRHKYLSAKNTFLDHIIVQFALNNFVINYFMNNF